MEKAFSPYDMAGKTLKNKIVMAPMTRSRAENPGALPTDQTALYYAQRSSAGFIVSEGIQPSIGSQGYINTPGLHSSEQILAWKKVTDAVHEKGGIIFAQLMHAGRIGHTDLFPAGLETMAPSPVAAQGQVYTQNGPQELGTPKEMSEIDILEAIADFASAANNAMAAGFDGVEIHGANGYLVHQFLATNSNLRTDGWGNSTEGRIKFAVEVAKAISAAIGSENVGIRLSPANPFNSISEDDIEGTYEALISELAKLNLGYLHFMENPMQNNLIAKVRTWWPNTLIVNTFVGENSKGKADLASIEAGKADLVSFGQLFLANPDLPARLETDGPYNAPDHSTYYGGDHRGYTDYPSMSESTVS